MNPRPLKNFNSARMLLGVLVMLGGGALRGIAEPVAASAPVADAAVIPAAAPIVALMEAVARAPVLNAARQRAEAARARVETSGRFPDPEIEGMVSTVRNDDGDFAMWEVSLRQPLPKRGERAASHERARAVVSMAEADYAVMAGEMAATIAMGIAEGATARERARLISEQISRIEKTLGVVDVRIATGAGKSVDRLVLQSRIATLRLMIAQDERMADDALAEARGRLGLAPDAALPDFAFPAVSEIDAASAPALRLSEARVAEARAMVRMARAEARPMTAVGLRFSREEMAMGQEDVVGVSFMTEIPWRGRAYARAEERAARAEESASRAEGDAVRHRVAAAVSRVERAVRLADTARKLAGETRQRLDAEYEALVRTAGLSSMGGDSSTLTALELLDRRTDAELQVVEAEGAVRSARAELWRYAPAALFYLNP